MEKDKSEWKELFKTKFRRDLGEAFCVNETLLDQYADVIHSLTTLPAEIDDLITEQLESMVGAFLLREFSLPDIIVALCEKTGKDPDELGNQILLFSKDHVLNALRLFQK